MYIEQLNFLQKENRRWIAQSDVTTFVTTIAAAFVAIFLVSKDRDHG